MESKSSLSGIAREIHGIQHVSRAALYIPVLANLYRRYDDPEALKLTDEDIKFIQIAALFHDSMRQTKKWITGIKIAQKHSMCI